MAITNGLITSAEFAQFTGYAVPSDATKLLELEACIESASRMTETYSGREFHPTSSSARYFDADDWLCVRISDASAVTTVKIDTDQDGTYDTTVTDYQKLPVGGVSPTLGTVPYTSLRATLTYWPQPLLRVSLIEVTAVWGWAAIPIQVKHACAVIAQDLLRDATAGFGGLQISELGIVNSRIPQRAKDILGPFQRMDYVGGMA